MSSSSSWRSNSSKAATKALARRHGGSNGGRSSWWAYMNTRGWFPLRAFRIKNPVVFLGNFDGKDSFEKRDVHLEWKDEMAIATPKFGGLVFGSDKSILGSGDRHGSFPVGAFCQEIFWPQKKGIQPPLLREKKPEPIVNPMEFWGPELMA